MKFAHCCRKQIEEENDEAKQTETVADDEDAEKVRTAVDVLYCLFENCRTAISQLCALRA